MNQLTMWALFEDEDPVVSFLRVVLVMIPIVGVAVGPTILWWP